MQVVRERGFGPEYSGIRVSNAWASCLEVWDNLGKPGLIPDEPTRSSDLEGKDGLCYQALPTRWARVPLASWRGNGSPRLRWVAGLRGRSATLGLRHGPDSYGRQQSGILGNGRKPDPATPREG